jgi:glutathione synthase
MSNRRIGVVMDPIPDISPAKDSTLAMLLESQKRGHQNVYFEQGDLWLDNGEPWGLGRQISVNDRQTGWFKLGDPENVALGSLDAILMRKDPPFDTEYIYTTYILERAEIQGAWIVNRPASLRDINEKAFTAWFPECCPPTLITRSMTRLRDFLREHGRIVVKPLDGMGGRSIFVIDSNDNNANVILETLTDYENQFTIGQKFIPEIAAGDKRILLVDGVPAPYALARIPAPDDNRGNLVAGALPEIRELTDQDRRICSRVGPILKERGVIFAGLDVIGDYLTEINVTSPTGIRELSKLADINVAGDLFDCIENKISSGKATA